ncbi:hypothetical protein [Streptantibioticus cattleyicolor]|uniref:Uncharacterized protein n=1 Tax=Streptantibioticus cattleyicolor (strain ATCC 35852 / DSM 46488 / JCM 4925 / NBRC 14057 / NRRL 8057) TaxID=1003195 RepID=F8JMR8_STREN|nr:hypothetical protein [Streptantibioticus cattleyicolor]AEW99296.1 hypothetical protein SCATT_p11030 [Streptantibioticus cattleyicolor NRRL 8057 = DSM 46488]CCB71664.1 Predicted protein [Streptantibioticus cattleyicolor NRRL 8057 = DSM 46488]
MDRSLLSTRAALVLSLAVAAGVGAGVLAALAGDGAARCVLCGLAAVGPAVPFFNTLVAADDRADRDGGRRRG